MISVAQCLFTVGWFPFYSVILGFRGTIDSPPLLPWVPEPMLCQQFWWLVPSLFLIIFSFCCFFPKSLLLTFHSRVSLESWPLISLPSRRLHLTFLDSTFFPFVIFLEWANSISARLKVFPSYFPSWFFFLGSSRYQPFVHELLVPKLSNSFLHHWVADKDVSVLRSLCFWALLLSCLNLILALLHVPRTSSSWQSLGILAQFLSLESILIFWSWQDSLHPFFPSFYGP